MFTTDRTEMRRFYQQAWRKFVGGEVLEPLELELARIIEQHPEYHTLLASDESLQTDFDSDDGAHNPFLHMSMHMAIREQVSTDRPPGIAAIHARLASGTGDAHGAEHAMMECLGEVMWRSQRDNRPPDENHYLECLGKLARR